MLHAIALRCQPLRGLSWESLVRLRLGFVLWLPGTVCQISAKTEASACDKCDNRLVRLQAVSLSGHSPVGTGSHFLGHPVLLEPMHSAETSEPGRPEVITAVEQGNGVFELTHSAHACL